MPHKRVNIAKNLWWWTQKQKAIRLGWKKNHFQCQWFKEEKGTCCLAYWWQAETTCLLYLFSVLWEACSSCFGPLSAIWTKSQQKATLKNSSIQSAGPEASFAPTLLSPCFGFVSKSLPPDTGTWSSQTRVNVNLNHAAKGTAADREDDDNGDQEDEEDPMTWRMRRLPKAKWYAAIGKVFTLKYWPWADTSWWIDGDDYGGDGGELSALEEAAWTCFFEYMQVLSIKESEWMTRSFRKSVMILFHASEPNLTTSW